MTPQTPNPRLTGPAEVRFLSAVIVSGGGPVNESVMRITAQASL